VPDCRGRTSIGTGQGTGLTNRNLGDIVSNEETHALTVAEEAVHTHSVTQGTHTHTDSGHAHYCGGVDHLHSDDHYHTWPLQGSHTHGISDGGHNHNYTAYPQGQVQGAAGAGAWTTGGGAAATTAAANQANAGLSIAAANTPAGNTNYKSQSGFSNSTGAADRSLAFNSNNASAVLSTDSAGAIACANAGSGAAHNNMQPSLAFNRIIKT
jgi:microcystin-dependent protein